MYKRKTVNFIVLSKNASFTGITFWVKDFEEKQLLCPPLCIFLPPKFASNVKFTRA